MGPDEFEPDELDEFDDVDAFLVEWNLGVRCGLDIIETLRADERLRSVPVLVVTAHPTRSLVSAVMHLGAQGVVCKPYTSAEVRERVRALR